MPRLWILAGVVARANASLRIYLRQVYFAILQYLISREERNEELIVARDMRALTPQRRQLRILEEDPEILTELDDLEKSRRISAVVNTFIGEYFELVIEQDANRPEGTVLDPALLSDELDALIFQFRESTLAKLRKYKLSRADVLAASRNLYEMAGATRLSFANKATRALSTTMGLLWERVANISPYAINPEIEFNLRIKGIDLIARNYHSGEIEYQQLKTQQNTLTGSQQGRSVNELLIHENPVFCACFPNQPWTFNHSEIPRTSGQDFWSRIGMPYDVVAGKVRCLILDLEQEYVELLVD